MKPIKKKFKLPAPLQQQYHPPPQYATQPQQQPIQPQAQPASVPSTLVVHPMAPQSQPQVLQQPQVQTQIQPQAPQRQIVNMSEINPIMSHPQPRAAPGYGSVAPGTTQVVPQGVPTQVQYQQPPTSGALTSTPSAGAAPAAATVSSGADNGSARHVSDRQQALHHKQQRLLLLHHACNCQHDEGRCPVTPHCAGMKRLWKHMEECKDQKCLVPHCVSSRNILSHLRRCKDFRCPICGPVRKATPRSHKMQKHMQALKQRHQLAVQMQALKQRHQLAVQMQALKQRHQLAVQQTDTEAVEESTALKQVEFCDVNDESIHIDEITPRVNQLLALNSGGRRILEAPSFPPYLWPHILGRSSNDPNVLFFLLHEESDVLAERTGGTRKRKRGDSGV